MPRIIKIDNHKGLLTNGNRNNIPPEYSLQLKNFRAYNGKLISVPTPFGVKTSAITNTIKTLATFRNNHLNGGSTGTDDWLYIGVYVHSTTKVATFYAYYPVTDTWIALALTSGTYYHKEDENPVIQDNQIIRFLPGNVGLANGTNESYGLWLGYIDRDFFDGHYLHTHTVADANHYLADFHRVPTTITPPSIVFTGVDIEGGTFAAGTYKYKFSYIYDGIQESLFSGEFKHTAVVDKNIKLTFSLTKASHNRRITSMRIYRMDPTTGGYGVYKNIQDIEFDRPSSEVYRSTQTTNMFGGMNGQYFIHITDTALQAFDFQIGTDYAIKINSVIYEIKNISGTGHYNFELRMIVKNTLNAAPIATTNNWNVAWELLYWIAGPIYVSLGTPILGTSGAYAGADVLITNTTIGTGNLINWYLWFADLYYRLITDNAQKAIRFSGSSHSTTTQGSWAALNTLKGQYFCDDAGANVNYTFFDANLTLQEEHPLGTETRIKINGKYARVISGRLWQFNIILDPGGKNEERVDWASYSEDGQLDVNPVRNTVYIADAFGGEGTGLLEMSGYPVFLKPNSITWLRPLLSIIDTTSFPFQTTKCIHLLGNIAPRGAINIGQDAFVIWHDGIYRLRPNNLADSDSTPTETLRISEPINDKFLAFSKAEKESAYAFYDWKTNEVVWKFTLDGYIYDRFYAYNITDGSWREITPYQIRSSIITFDEIARPLIFRPSDKKVYAAIVGDDSEESVYESKFFELSPDRKEVIREMVIDYKAPDGLLVDFNLEFPHPEESAIKEFNIPASTKFTTYKFAPKISASGFSFEIHGAHVVEIGSINIETD